MVRKPCSSVYFVQTLKPRAVYKQRSGSGGDNTSGHTTLDTYYIQGINTSATNIDVLIHTIVAHKLLYNNIYSVYFGDL